MGSERTFGQLVADYLVASVEADGTFVRIMNPDILVNTSTRTRVEARFGATHLLTSFRGAVRPAVRDGTILIIADETRERLARSATGLGDIVAYEYDLIDQPYGSEIGFHFHTEPNGRGPEIHRHEMVNGGQRERWSDPGGHSVPLDQALSEFRGRLWANRYPGAMPAPSAATSWRM